jgi:hypothetical protein
MDGKKILQQLSQVALVPMATSLSMVMNALPKIKTKIIVNGHHASLNNSDDVATPRVQGKRHSCSISSRPRWIDTPILKMWLPLHPD